LCAISFAATQGQWGRTSSATAKITLIIPPKHSSVDLSLAQHKNGFEALHAYCQNRIDTAPSASFGLYQFTLPGQQNADLNTTLVDLCQGKKVSQQSDTATLLVAPL